jgi:hypothetical protein
LTQAEPFSPLERRVAVESPDKSGFDRTEKDGEDPKITFRRYF